MTKPRRRLPPPPSRRLYGDSETADDGDMPGGIIRWQPVDRLPPGWVERTYLKHMDTEGDTPDG